MDITDFNWRRQPNNQFRMAFNNFLREIFFAKVSSLLSPSQSEKISHDVDLLNRLLCITPVSSPGILIVSDVVGDIEFERAENQTIAIAREFWNTQMQ